MTDYQQSRRPRPHLHADGRPRPRSRCSPRSPASARSTRWCSAASRRRASPPASTTRKPKVMVTSDAGMRNGKAMPLQAAGRRVHPARRHAPRPRGDRGPRPRQGHPASKAATSTTPRCAPSTWTPGAGDLARIQRALVHPLHQRHHRQAQGRAARHRRLLRGARRVDEAHLLRRTRARPMFSTSDIGWVVGHSYIIYGPLIAGMTTIMYEGLPIRPDAGIWWKIVADYKVTVMFSSPTAIRVLKKQDPAFITKYDTLELRTCSSPASRSTSRPPAGSPTRWACPIIDNYWQTETGWPMLQRARGRAHARKFGSPSFPVYGYDLRSRRGRHRDGAGREGRAGVVPPLPPGCLTTVWGDDERFVKTYFTTFKDRIVYSTVRLGHAGCGGLLLHPRAHRRRHQRRRPPPRHPRDRGGRAGPLGRSRKWRWWAWPTP
jgi:propionyl-CoA synthetase